MTRKIKNCGCCSGFQKLKNMVGNSGLCVVLDRRTDEDRGHRCKHWKGIPYKYKVKNKILTEITELLEAKE